MSPIILQTSSFFFNQCFWQNRGIQLLSGKGLIPVLTEVQKDTQCYQNSIACHREIVRIKASVQQTSLLSHLKTSLPQQLPVTPSPSDSKLSTSVPVRS